MNLLLLLIISYSKATSEMCLQLQAGTTLLLHLCQFKFVLQYQIGLCTLGAVVNKIQAKSEIATTGKIISNRLAIAGKTFRTNDLFCFCCSYQ